MKIVLFDVFKKLMIPEVFFLFFFVLMRKKMLVSVKKGLRSNRDSTYQAKTMAQFLTYMQETNKERIVKDEVS